MRVLAKVLTGALVLCASQTAMAQDGPTAGTWAVEGTNFGASLLRFRSSNSAWVLNGSAVMFRQEVQQFDPVTGNLVTETETSVSSQVRVGIRRYAPAVERVRTFSTLSAVLGYIDNGDGGALQFGASGEIGAAYFFSPHVSMGGAASIDATYQNERSGPFGRSLIVSLGNLRLLGTVYF